MERSNPVLDHQVIDGVTGQRQFRKQHQVRATAGGATCFRDDPREIALHIAYQQVELRERNPQ